MKKSKNYKYILVLLFFIIGMYFNVENVNAYNMTTNGGGCELDMSGHSCMPFVIDEVHYICYADGGGHCTPR